jgi:parallel beta-helix repeat protein
MHSTILVELKKIVLLSFVLVLLSTAVAVMHACMFIRPVEAGGTIYIRADGSVDPQTAPIQRDGARYTLTGNITSDVNGIVIERDDMAFNGAGYSIQGTEQAYDYYFDYKGIYVSGRSNVTIKNTGIKGFTCGIHINSSSHNTLFGNKITNNRYGVFLCDSSYNIMFGNNITANEYYGIFLSNSSFNCISKNEVIGNFDAGIFLTIYSSCNVISGNYIKPRGGGVWIWQYSKNNSFIGNIVENRYATDLSLCSNNHIYGKMVLRETIGATTMEKIRMVME